MIKPVTCVCMVLAAGSGLYLYQSKHRAQLLDREIQRTLKQIEVTKERTVRLNAEWTELQDMDRLTELSQKHLGLRTLAPTQFVSLADAASRLPAPVAPGTVSVPDEPTGPVLALPARPVTAPATNAPAAAAPVQVAEVRPPTPPRPAAPRPALAPAVVPAVVPAVAPAPPAAQRPVATSLVSVAAAPIVARPAPAARAVTGGPAPGSIGEAVLRAGIIKAPAAPALAALPAAAPAAPAPGYATPSYATPVYAPASYGSASYGSALGGMGRTALPPPTPYSPR